MSKVMFVTVGTSLFQSASWEPQDDGELPVKVPYYRQWLAAEQLGSPEARRATRYARETENELREALDGKNAAQWARFLPSELFGDGWPAPATVMRYGAELATILKLHELEGKSRSLRDFLRSYEIHVIYDDRVSERGTAPVFVAARHLIGYLDAIAGTAVAAPLEIPGLSSTDPELLIGSKAKPTGLWKLACTLEPVVKAGERDVDILFTGGYKLYGVVLSHLSSYPRVRLMYIHETADTLVIFAENQIGVRGRFEPEPVRRQIDFKSGPGGPGS